VPDLIEKHQDYCGRKFWTYMYLHCSKNKQFRGIWDLNHIVNSVPHSSSFGYRKYMYLKTRMRRSKPHVGITCAKGSRFYFAIEYVYVFKTRTGRIKRHLKYQLSFMLNLYIICKCKKVIYFRLSWVKPVTCCYSGKLYHAQNRNHFFCFFISKCSCCTKKLMQ